ncbi:bifunctional hydroxymethylpyrimidine kinase/phosphomethylpyrimidine kinase [Nitrosarchaeum sp. AC2]|uniref:bifunctional hydroxymethylpyrimidine kinase/phosphomethylpyrimidine kinase n=1 Tax=Nitrosarchaeum sp. AC2 TaxID=2259673 RepID=UPI0015CD09DB|nr:bifunctional hydroxymethylpyrimidine kinase/phosphomethylpyrimidine kinase [Nitrosarchaeum sp. AC2]QLH10577.1 bifunctional hydroxymethylpyrimidine kinase/phosphomethylpyrimidine kinase [Nitrosarchaeum sp. AC2]
MNLLSIGGSDPSSGAGIQSDIKTFDMLNGYGLTVITAVTGQNTSNFGMIQPVSKKILKNQLELLISDFKIDGIKIGMVYNSDIIKIIHNELKQLKIPIVLDPVIKSTTGGLLIKKNAIKDFKKYLIPLATVITPNKFEAEFLSQIKINSKKSLLKSALKIQKIGAKSVIITGIETKNEKISDFILEEKTKYIVSSNIIPKTNHGSGCNHSSALLVSLVNGKSLKESAKFSKQFTYNSIKNAKNIGRGIEITQIKKRDNIQIELSNGINKFIGIKNIYKNIPECQTNFVFSKINPKSIKDIVGIAGRIVKTGNKVMVAGDLEYGGSKHVATALIAMNKKFPEIRSAINLKYNEENISKLKKTKLIISRYDRNSEPNKIKTKEGSSIEWGIKSAIKKLEAAPDVIYHKGDFGKEPMIIIFAKTPVSIIEKVSKLFN